MMPRLNRDLLPATPEEALDELRWLLDRATLDPDLCEDLNLWNYYSTYGVGEAALQRLEIALGIDRQNGNGKPT